MCKEGIRGVFWLVEDELVIARYEEGIMEGLSKAGNNYNHEKLWESVKPKGCNKKYNYYPRGRVEVSNKGKPLVYMSPYIDYEQVQAVLQALGIDAEPIIHIDGSKHYHCHFDEDMS